MSDQAQLALASRSPRRRALLEQIGIRYRCLPVLVSEQHRQGESAMAYVERLARDKARAGLARDNRLPVLGADTAVVLGGRVFGKPSEAEPAADILAALAGREHQVMTGIAVCDSQRTLSDIQISTVRFAPLERGQIEAYCMTGEGVDKAGAYAIQGRGAAFVEDLQGSYSGVMGLPLFETVSLLLRFGLQGVARVGAVVAAKGQP